MLESFAQHHPRAAHAYAVNQPHLAVAEKGFQGSTKEVFLPSIQLQFDDVQYLGAPKGDQLQVELMIGALQQAVFAGEKRHIRSAHDLTNNFRRFNLLARRYGVDACLISASHFRDAA